MPWIRIYSRRGYSQNRLNVNRIPYSFLRSAYSIYRAAIHASPLGKGGNMSIYLYLSIYLSTYLPVYLPIYLSFFLSTSIYMYLHLSISFYIYLYTHLSIYVCLSIYIYIYLSIHLYVCIHIYVSISHIPPLLYWSCHSFTWRRRTATYIFK